MNGRRIECTILGSGSSGGVPRIGGHWGACDPKNPKNRRSRCSLLVRQFDSAPHPTAALVDTSPDMREQLLAANVGRLNAVLYTHDHADQTHGIDDLRMVAINIRSRVRIYADDATQSALTTRFGYCFETPEGSGYPPILDLHRIDRPLAPVTVEGEGGPLLALPFEQEHGSIMSLGFRFGPIAYSADVSDMPDESFEALKGVKCWIVDALRYTPHPTHANVETALKWIERVKPEHAILTNLHVDLDYETLRKELPAGVEPAYDGLSVEYEL
jgi:phosphoribosyl 1,2-cyclic phosphate phosphodiesterase